ncbi:CPSF A subunit region-domain-containing protein [Lophiotrema nucula]|uniref:Protein CFT1 n=1 Tax=Lophiotrema nucula TaxID=690887 RepID=A0A6A5ZHL9_9PLEO|nr:CPSF A subunit region-domain-containing protein [Lophiotrema nucula]
MQCYTELAPPTAVSHALNLPFLTSKAHNLVVAKNSLLQVFETKSTTTEVASDGVDAAGNAAPNFDTEAADVPLQRTENTGKLVLVGEFPLAGTVISLARIKVLGTKSKGEALLVAFRDAKLSLVEWDPETYSLHTISIHYYENPELLGAPWAADLKDTHNFLTADPTSRCAALKFGVHHLAILPFRQPDIAEDEYDSDLEGAPPKAMDMDVVNGQDVHKTPYNSSFVLPLTHLDPLLTQPVHLAFLYEYREPTFGIIASSKVTTPSLIAERRDILTYTVFTLDLEQKASTTLLSIQGLPYDVNKVVPLPLPIGGALLLGANELIHVDQAGKTNGVAVNEFAKTSTSFPLVDQSDLALRLEGCIVEVLSPDTGDLLIVLNDGKIITLTFTLDGRNVSGITLQLVDSAQGGDVLPGRASCASNLGRGRIFVGSEDADSVLLGWASKTQPGRKRSQADIAADSEDSDMDEDEDNDDMDDDLYGDTTTTVKKITSAAAEPTAPGSYTFRIHDVLPSLAPIRDVVLSPTVGDKRAASASSSSPSALAGDILASHGRGKAGAVTVLNRELKPTQLAQSVLASAKGLWAVHAKQQAPEGMITDAGDTEGNLASDAEYDQYLVVCKARDDENDDTVVYQVNGNELEETSKGDFEREEGTTLDVGVLARGTKVVQIMRSEVRTYDSELNMDVIHQMEERPDGEDGEELKIINASFADPYLLVLRDDSTLKIFRADANGDIEELETSLTGQTWLSASLYKSSVDSEVYAFLLTAEQGLRVYAMSNLEEPSYVAEGLGFLPPILTADYKQRASSAKETLTEIIAADLGDSVSKSPYLIARTSGDNLVIYKAYHYPPRPSSEPWTKNLRWTKQAQPHLPRLQTTPNVEDESVRTVNMLKALDNVNGFSAVFLQGANPSFILKEASSLPRVIDLSSKSVKGLTRFHTSGCQRGFAYIDAEDQLRISQLPSQTHYGHLGWAARTMSMGSEIYAVSHHPRGIYVVGTGQTEEFTLPEDTYHYEWAKEDTNFRPHVEQGILKVIDSETWSVIETIVLDPQEEVLCIKTLNLEVSENTHERRPLIAVGTAIVRGEDLATKGNIRIFEVITVVPEPGRPETNKKLRLIVKDEVKGAVSAISDIGSQGFMIMAQGQKCMVRGLKEDGTLLPVAFMDMQCYVTVLKSLPQTNMLLMGDAYKGLWFTGYNEEPYKMLLFGRSRTRLEVMAADFLPFEKSLHIIIADADMNLQVLQFDPENPKSMGGLRLLHKSTFHTGHFPVAMNLLKGSKTMPVVSDFLDGNSTEATQPDNSGAQSLDQILLTTQTGALGLLTPLSESTYRRLSGLSTYLANTLESACGLNPRSYRAVENELGGGGGTRGIVDGTLLLRWGELGKQRQKEGLGRFGAQDDTFAQERDILMGGGLFGRK